MYQKILALLVSACLLSILTACTYNTGKSPQWLENPSTEYPREQYLSAVGQADKRENAGNRALANLAKIFQVAIKEQSMDFSSSEAHHNSGNSQTSNEQRASRFVSTQAKQVLEGATVVEYWQDTEGQIYALAIIDKSTAAKRFKGDIDSADNRVKELVDYASHRAETPTSALSALERARLIQLQRDNLTRSLSIVSNQNIPTRYSSEQLESIIRKALATLIFSITSDDELLSSELQNAVATLGIQYDPLSTTVLTGIQDSEPAQQEQGWQWIRGSLELSLSIDNKVIEKRRWPFKVSATDKAVVEQRAKDEINKQMPAHLYELLSSSKIN